MSAGCGTQPVPAGLCFGLPPPILNNPGQTEREALVQVVVRDNNVDQALRALKKKMQREGIFREMKLRNYYEKPSEKRAREKAEAIRRARKLARKKAQREGGGGSPGATRTPKPRGRR
jgi:small subunit ribosomal protein S21